jgi:hypothetical protein
MRKLSVLIIALTCGFTALAQQQPFLKYGYKVKIATLSNGKYIEHFDQDTIVQIGTVMLNRRNGKLVSFVKSDTTFGEYSLQPELISRWMSPDPLAHEFYNQSPYNFSLNNPILFVDPDGAYPWPIHVRSFISTATTGGGLFSGDNRGASFNGTSRVYSAFTVDPSARTVSQPVTKSDRTVFYGIPGKLPPVVKTGTPEGSNDNINFSENTASFNFSHSGKDPITPGFATPALDVHAGLSFNEDLKKGILTVTGSFTGDKFPSTEAFITDQSGKTKLFLGAQMEKGGVGDLYGDNKENLFKVNMQVKFDDKGNFTGVQQGKTTYSVTDWNKKVQEGFK